MSLHALTRSMHSKIAPEGDYPHFLSIITAHTKWKRTSKINCSTGPGIRESTVSFLLRYRYLILSFILILLMGLHTLNNPWQADFWVHSAAIKELAANPLSPSHPRLLLDAPSAFYSLYTVGLALFSRFTGISPLTVLAVAGLGNLILFLFSFHIFITLLLKRSETAFYALLFVLLLWGRYPWWWSGFFHLRVFGYVLPYPSTFAISLVFLAFAMFILLINTGRRIWFVPIAAVVALVLSTHPLSFVFLMIGLISLSLGIRLLPLQDYLILAGVFLLAFVLNAAWPYFPFFRLLFGESSLHGEGNRILYSGLVERIYPALLGLPIIIWRFKRNRLDPLGLMFIGLSLVYIYGGMTAKWGYGRVISYVLIILQITIADWISGIESRLSFHRVPPSILKLGYAGLIVLALFGLSFRHMIGPFLGRCRPGQESVIDQYLFLQNYTGPRDVILAELEDAGPIPTFGGKVVATPKPIAFVRDDARRRQDVLSFFSKTATESDREEIINKYRVGFILLRKNSAAAAELKQAFQTRGSVLFSNQWFDLIRLKKIGGSEK